MACRFICDGCKKEAPGFANRMGQWFKPHDWFERTDNDGTQTACSRECIEAIAKASGKTHIVLPL